MPPVSLELHAFLKSHEIQQAKEDRDLRKIPRLAVPDRETLKDLACPAGWHEVNVQLETAGLTEHERQSVHHVLEGASTVELPSGSHYLTVEEIRELTDTHLLTLKEAHAEVDRRAVVVLRQLFGRINGAVAK